MQTSLARRQRHRRNGNARGSGGGQGSLAGCHRPAALPVRDPRPPRDRGLRVRRGRLFLLQPGPARPAAACSNNITLQPGDGRLRPDRHDRAGPLRRDQADGHPLLGRCPPVLIDATTSVEDKTFWQNAGFDPIGIISAGRRHRHRQAPGRLDDHPAARPQRGSCPRSVLTGSTYERKIREIIQSIRLTQELPPGVAGKQQIMAGLPQPELLRQPELRHRRGRRELLRDHRPVQARPRPGGDPGRDPPVADRLRPGPERGRDVHA